MYHGTNDRAIPFQVGQQLAEWHSLAAVRGMHLPGDDHGVTSAGVFVRDFVMQRLDQAAAAGSEPDPEPELTEGVPPSTWR